MIYIYIYTCKPYTYILLGFYYNIYINIYTCKAYTYILLGDYYNGSAGFLLTLMGLTTLTFLLTFYFLSLFFLAGRLKIK